MDRKHNKYNNHNVMATNRRARHDYTILKTVEAGISLQGNEIKSVRNHRLNLKDGFARIRHGEAYLENVHISPFEEGNVFNPINPRRDRKLLLHKKQIKKLHRDVQKQGITLIPLKVYIKHGVAKVLIGVAKGKHDYDKREALKKRAIKLKINRDLKQY